MATFSKNGKPMGKTPSNSVNKNNRWSKDEDNYLSLALKEGISATEVAARLGRTKNAVYFRKLTLGLDGAFARAKGYKHEPKSKLVSPEQVTSVTSHNEFAIFQLETGIPVPSKGGRTSSEERNQAREVLSKMYPGQSFVVPRRLVHVVRHLANMEFEAYKIKASAIAADKKFFRIFRLA
jgi:hypothetical protein